MMTKRFHISLSTENFEQSLADYSARLGCAPDRIVPNRYARWRTESLNFTLSCKSDQPGGQVRHLGFEDGAAEKFSEERDSNGIVWERFSLAQQDKEIEERIVAAQPINHIFTSKS